MTIPGDINYTFTLIVKKDKRNCSASVQIDMRSTITPLLGIDNAKTYSNPNEPNLFSVRVDSRYPDAITY